MSRPWALEIFTQSSTRRRSFGVETSGVLSTDSAVICYKIEKVFPMYSPGDESLKVGQNSCLWDGEIFE